MILVRLSEEKALVWVLQYAMMTYYCNLKYTCLSTCKPPSVWRSLACARSTEKSLDGCLVFMFPFTQTAVISFQVKVLTHRLGVIFIFHSSSSGHFGGIPPSFQSTISPLQMRLAEWGHSWISQDLPEKMQKRFRILWTSSLFEKTKTSKSQNDFSNCNFEVGDLKIHSYH